MREASVPATVDWNFCFLDNRQLAVARVMRSDNGLQKTVVTIRSGIRKLIALVRVVLRIVSIGILEL